MLSDEKIYLIACEIAGLIILVDKILCDGYKHMVVLLNIYAYAACYYYRPIYQKVFTLMTARATLQ